MASDNTRLDFDIDTLISKDVSFKGSKTIVLYATLKDSSAQAFYENQQNPGIHNNTLNGTMTHTTVDPLETASLCQNLGVQMQLPSLNAFTTEAALQFRVTFCEDDLYTIVQQGFGQTASGKFPSQSHNLNGSNQVSHSHMKVER
ncbi:transcription factor bHLH62-like [Senna tora]|uniref:Transcription factor bHLH62-like n=1 Tax=Senna tora TaxID=362788 RepID=A0A834TRN8_9FABA|nr:transcription factor bHLH62-like [Senna tora]